MKSGDAPDYIDEHVARHSAIIAQRASDRAAWIASNPWPTDRSALGISPSDVTGYAWMRARGD